MDKKERQSIISELFGYGLTIAGIAEVVQASVSTVGNDLRQLRKLKKLADRLSSKEDVFRHRLYWYASLYYTPGEIKLLAKKVLEKLLSIPVIVDSLMIMGTLASFLSVPKHTSDQKSYVELMKAVWNIPESDYGSVFQEITDFWINYLSEIENRDRKDIPGNLEDLKLEVIKKYSRHCRSYVANTWAPFISTLIDECIATLDKKEAHVLNAIFGLKGEKKTIKDLAIELKVSEERIRQLLKRGVRHLREGANGETLRGVYFSDSILKRLVEGPLFQKIKDYQTRKENISSEDAEVDILLTPISYFNFSVRTKNCLKNSDICLIGEIVQRSEKQLLKSSNFGRKSLNEINDFLSQHGLSLGMELDAGMIDRIRRKRVQYLERRN